MMTRVIPILLGVVYASQPSLEPSSSMTSKLIPSYVQAVMSLIDDDDESEPPVSVSSSNQASLPDSFYQRLNEVSQVRFSMRRVIELFRNRMEATTKDVAESHTATAELIAEKSTVLDCRGVIIPDSLSERFVKAYHSIHLQEDRNVALRSLPIEVGCYLIQRSIDRALYRHESKRVSLHRLGDLIKLSEQIIGEIDSIFQGPEPGRALNDFYLLNLVPMSDSRGKWIQAVHRNLAIRDRFETFSAETSQFRSFLTTQKGVAPRGPLSPEAEKRAMDKIYKVGVLFVESGRDILIGTEHSLILNTLERMRHEIQSNLLIPLIKRAVGMVRERIDISFNEEQTLSFEAIGSTPRLSYNRRNLPVGIIAQKLLL